MSVLRFWLVLFAASNARAEVHFDGRKTSSDPCLLDACVFPFTYYDVQYNACSQIGTGGVGTYDYKWCSTQATYVVDSGNYERCDDCPAVTCSGYTCGAGWLDKSDMASTGCIADTCTNTECCEACADGGWNFSFSGSTIDGDASALRAGSFLVQNIGHSPDGTSLRLRIQTSSTIASDPSLSSWGSVSISGISSPVDFTFYVETMAGDPVSATFPISFYDVDGDESAMTLDPSYAGGEAGSLEVGSDTNGDGRLNKWTYSGSDQKTPASQVQFVFANTQNATVQLDSPASNRFFQIVMKYEIELPACQATCNGYTCDAGWLGKSGMASITCSADTCTNTECCDQEQCICQQTWNDAEYDARCVNQIGCASPSCDEDSPWCLITNPGCATEETDDGDGWSYCTPGEDPPSWSPAYADLYCSNWVHVATQSRAGSALITGTVNACQSHCNLVPECDAITFTPSTDAGDEGACYLCLTSVSSTMWTPHLGDNGYRKVCWQDYHCPGNSTMVCDAGQCREKTTSTPSVASTTLPETTQAQTNFTTTVTTDFALTQLSPMKCRDVKYKTYTVPAAQALQDKVAAVGLTIVGCSKK